MEDRLYKSSFFHKQEDSTGTPPDNANDSCFSGDEAAEVSMPSPRKRRGAKKKVISVPIIEGDGSRSKGEVYPPQDSWSWRKYGQKPIKGSPYPRGYYRCSSSKGCPARKQVERSRLDPTMLLITYCSEHNHLIPAAAAASTKHHHLTTTTTTTPANSSPTTSTGTAGDNNTAAAGIDKSSPEELDLFAYQNDNGFSEIAGELGWFSDMGNSTFVENTSSSSSMVGSTWNDSDVALMLPIREEDQSLYGDLGELPECSFVFRRYSVETPCYGGTE